MEQLKFSYIADRNINWYNHFGKLFSESTKARYMNILWPSQFCCVYILNINEYLCLPKNTYKNVYSSIIQNGQELKTFQMFNSKIEKYIEAYSYNGILPRNGKKKTSICNSMDESYRHNVERKKPDTKEHILCDPTYMKLKNR